MRKMASHESWVGMKMEMHLDAEKLWLPDGATRGVDRPKIAMPPARLNSTWVGRHLAAAPSVNFGDVFTRSMT